MSLSMRLPITKKENITDKINGFVISDPYRWLEDKDNLEVINWIDTQNKYTETLLRNDIQKIFLEELAKYFKVERNSTPVSVKNQYFYTRQKPDEDQRVLYHRHGLTGDPIKIVDPNCIATGGLTSLDYWNVSPNGKYVSYGLSVGGDEMSTIYVFDINKNKELKDKIVHCRNSSISWLPDDSGFFYTRNPRPGEVSKKEEHLYSKVYFHKLGESSDKDKLIFGKDLPKETEFRLSISLDGKYLAIHATKLGIYIFNVKKRNIISLTKDKRAYFTLSFLKDKVILYTDYKADNFRILSTTLDKLFSDIDDWEEFYPENDYLLTSVNITSEKILLEYLINVSSEIIETDHSGNLLGKISLPKYSSIVDISANVNQKEYFYSINSFTDPLIIYRYNPDKNKDEEYQRINNPIDPDKYTVKQLWYKSKDGTDVPLFVIHKTKISLDGKNPTILEGYGGFGKNSTPFFPRNYISWIERGGIYAIANIRGGREFGTKWHIDGRRAKKQNSFDDFISAAEHLILQKYTDNDHLGIIGGSNGGLLVSAVAVQRPDLYKAVCSRVPLTDMVRFVKFGLGPLWVHEYGDPGIKEDLERILKWSPYHNVKEGFEYPNFLFITAENDTRVSPLHSRKMTALLQSVNKKNKVLLFSDVGAGHLTGKPISKIINQQSFVLTFFAQELGLKV